MVDPFGTDPKSTYGAGAERAKADLDARFQDARSGARSAADAASDGLNRFAAGARSAIDDATHGDTRAKVEDAAQTFRSQASQAAGEAKSAAAAIAEQARSRLAEIVDQQKAAGADKIAGVAKAAQSAAADLDKTNPQMARLVRSAADSVDRIASDVRSRDIGDVLDTLATFGRQQPVAFFGGAVLAGFLVSRFFKSDAPIASDAPVADVPAGNTVPATIGEPASPHGSV